MPYIIHYHNGNAIAHRELGERLTIGRGDGNDLQIDDATISGQHAVIEQTDGGGFEIRDLDSTNGILYRGEKVRQRTLSDGDYVVIGTHDLQFVANLPEPLVRTTRIRKSWIPGIFYTSE